MSTYYLRMTSRFDSAQIYRMANPVQGYEWGSLTAIPELLGVEPDGTPKAELWMGAHPKAPSDLIVGDERVGLPGLIDRYPEEILGRFVVDRFGNRLPFLFKVLAAQRALSIQAHPNVEQAREGFSRENEAGVPLGAPERDYRDDNHKPEVLCAITDFWGMCGFRPVEAVRRDLAAFEGERLAALRAHLDRPAVADGLRDFLEHLLRLGAGEAGSIAASIAAQCEGRQEPRFSWVRRLAREFPGDPGVLAPLFLNLVNLRPGEAIYLSAGELHAYLEGTGVELMANSDNVLRGGLTKKHIDVNELMRVLHFEESPVRIIRGESPASGAAGAGASLFELPIREFRLARIEVGPHTPFSASPSRSVEILLCVGGECSVAVEGSRGAPVRAGRGDSLLVPAAVGGYSIDGEAELYRADVPADDEAAAG